MIHTGSGRLLKAALVTTLAAIVAIWFRNRQEHTSDDLAPEWPPLTLAPEPPVLTDASNAVVEPTDGSAAPAPPGDWVSPDPEGNCPLSHPVKLKLKSGIFHSPDGASYGRTKADRCYASPTAAEDDGYRASKT